MINAHIHDFRLLASHINAISTANANSKGGADPAIKELCQRAHGTIQRTMGPHAKLIYAPDDRSEYDPSN